MIKNNIFNGVDVIFVKNECVWYNENNEEVAFIMKGFNERDLASKIKIMHELIEMEVPCFYNLGKMCNVKSEPREVPTNE